MCDWDCGRRRRNGRIRRRLIHCRVAFSSLLLALPITVPLSSYAQTTSEYREYVRQLQQEWQEAHAAYEALRDSLRSAPTVTIRTGTLTLVTPQEHSELVGDGSRIAWESIRQLGSDTLLLLSKSLLVPGAGWLNRYSRDLHGATTVSSQITVESDAQDVASRILSSLGVLLLDDWAAGMRGWLGGSVESHDLGMAWTYVELITAPSQAVRACYLGDLNSCNSSLALGEIADPVFEWYSADERRIVVERRIPSANPDLGQLWTECVEGRSDTACVDYLNSDALDEVPPPLSLGARRSLLSEALRLGGEGAYTRLVNSRDSDRLSALAAAAAQPADSLLAAWREAVLSARPVPTTLTRAGAAVAILWIVFFAVAATRSTRWRLR